MRVAFRRPLTAAAALATLALGACVGDNQDIINSPNPANLALPADPAANPTHPARRRGPRTRAPVVATASEATAAASK